MVEIEDFLRVSGLPAEGRYQVSRSGRTEIRIPQSEIPISSIMSARSIPTPRVIQSTKLLFKNLIKNPT
ncbi:hypothetical protein DDT91_03075 [Algoriphagus sp. AK58]|nr:hypothetical protein [Algoriphagus sp. AK58]